MQGQWKEWKPGDPVTVNRIVWDQAEIAQMQDVLDNDWFGPGPKVKKLAKLFAEFVGMPYCQPVNSGSSALTLAVDAMIELGYWKAGDHILHPLLTFPTSIAPAIRAGLIPVFVDIDLNTYQIDLQQAEFAISSYRIDGVIIPHLLGNICDMAELFKVLGGRPLIEDCCDTLGSYYDGSHVGTFGKVATFSFYGSHHMTTGGVGGALVTDDIKVMDIAKSMTHWGRNDYDSLPAGVYRKFERRYWYDTLGYDFQLTELQAAFGIVQLARVKTANELRDKRWGQLAEFFIDHGYDQYFHMTITEGDDTTSPSWFAFPITIKKSAPFSRKQLATHLIENKIEIRPIFTGNITKHPAFKGLVEQDKAIIVKKSNWNETTNNADLIGSNGLFLPSWGMSDAEMAYMLEVLEDFLRGQE